MLVFLFLPLLVHSPTSQLQTQKKTTILVILTTISVRLKITNRIKSAHNKFYKNSMASQLTSIVESGRFKDRKFARVVLNTIILIIVLMVMTLEILDDYDILDIFNDIQDNIIAFTTLCYMSALYSYGYQLPLFKHQWQVFLILYLTLAQAVYVLGYLTYTQYEQHSIIYLLSYCLFWIIFYGYMICTINNVKNDI